MKQEIMLVTIPTEKTEEICKILQCGGMDVSQDENIDRAKAGLQSHSPAFLLLDIGLEGAMSFLQEMSKSMFYPPPYIVAAGIFSSISECMTILDCGADICISKPLAANEILTVINAVVRRERKIARLHVGRLLPQIDYKDLSIDSLRRVVEMKGKKVELTEKEFDILYFLAHHLGHALTREEIYESVWKRECDSGVASVSGHIFSIRQKLGLNPKDKDYIQTVFGVGYRFGHLE